MTTLRFRVVEKAFQAKPHEVSIPSERPSEYFAKYVFNREKMFKYLPAAVYARLIDVIGQRCSFRPTYGRLSRRGNEAMGHEYRGYALYSLVPTPYGGHG